MSKGDCITNIEDLRRWWELNQAQQQPKPYFTIWRGTEQKVDRIVMRNTDISEPAEAWNALEEILEMHTPYGGLFRIFITDKPAHNNGISTLYRVGNPFQQSFPNMQGIAGYSNMKYFSQEEMDQRLAQERKIWELEQSIRHLRAEQDAKVGEMENMMGEFMPIIKDLAHKFGMKMMGFGPQAPAPMHNVPPMAGHIPDMEAPEEGFDYDRIEPALDALRGVFPDTETTLEKLARWAQQNPGMAQQLMSNLETQ